MEEATAKITLDHGFELASVPCGDFQDMTFDFSQDTAEIKIELER